MKQTYSELRGTAVFDAAASDQLNRHELRKWLKGTPTKLVSKNYEIRDNGLFRAVTGQADTNRISNLWNLLRKLVCNT